MNKTRAQIFAESVNESITWSIARDSPSNKVIAENLLPNKSVLDLGGGAANLLKYYSPTDYMCVDGMDMPEE